MKIGYARVSTKDQNLDLQTDALKAAGCEKIFKEKISGKNMERPELIKCFEKLQAGDCLIVYKLDRLGRSLKDLIEQVTSLEKRKVAFVSLNNNIDTSNATGKFIFHVFAALADFEREIIIERTKAGLTAARARGRKGGRPKGLSKEAWSKALMAKQLYDMQKSSVAEIANDLFISERTAYRYINAVRKYLEETEQKIKLGSTVKQLAQDILQ